MGFRQNGDEGKPGLSWVVVTPWGTTVCGQDILWLFSNGVVDHLPKLTR
jgi:hypothetical protein